MSVLTVVKKTFGIVWKIGGIMNSHLEKWLYSDDKLRHDIIVQAESIAYSEQTRIPNLFVHLKIYNRSLYSKIIANPASFIIRGDGNNPLIKLKSDGTETVYNNHRDLTAFTVIRFESNLSESELKKLKELYSLQIKNNCRGILNCSVTIPIECENRKLNKLAEFNQVAIHLLKEFGNE